MYEALCNRNFVLILLIFSFMQGMFVSFGSNIDELFSPPFGASQISELGIFVVLAGVLSSITSGIILNRFKKFLL